MPPKVHNKHDGTALYSPARITTTIRRTRICEQCRKPYQPQRSTSRFCSPACKQQAYRNRLCVTPSVTPKPNAANEPTGTEVFRYVRQADVPRFTAEGWEATPALEGTHHHGKYSVLMRRSEEDHHPKTIGGHEVIGLAPDDPCAYCGERDGTVYLIRNTYKGLSEPMHESCAAYWFDFYNRINKGGGQA